MKNLLVMRHAKASWKDQKLKDRERPLTKRGTKTAFQMGELLKEKELVPQLIVASSVVRSKETAEEVISASGYAGNVIYLDHLFMADWDVILDSVRLLPDTVGCVLLIGHNPGLEGLVQRLHGKVVSLPPAAIANLAVPIDSWKDIQKNTEAESMKIWKPKDVEGEDKESD